MTMAPPPSYDILAPMAYNAHTKAQKSTVKKEISMIILTLLLHALLYKW